MQQIKIYVESEETSTQDCVAPVRFHEIVCEIDGERMADFAGFDISIHVTNPCVFQLFKHRGNDAGRDAVEIPKPCRLLLVIGNPTYGVQLVVDDVIEDFEMSGGLRAKVVPLSVTEKIDVWCVPNEFVRATLETVLTL